MKKHLNYADSVVLTSLLLTLATPVSVLAESGAKSLFESEGTTVMRSDDSNNDASAPINPAKPATVRHTKKTTNSTYQASTNSSVTPVSYAGLQYWIDLKDANGRNQQVTTNHTFQSGDRIQLKVKSNTEGYLYVMNQGSSGRLNKLYPARGQMSELIQPGMVQTIPSASAIRFDNNPGNEKVSILLTKMPIYDEPNTPSPMTNSTLAAPVNYASPTSYSACAGSKDLFSEENAGAAIDCVKNNYGSGSKDLFAEEDSTSVQPASYAVVPANNLDAGKVLSVDFNLIHR